MGHVMVPPTRRFGFAQRTAVAGASSNHPESVPRPVPPVPSPVRFKDRNPDSKTDERTPVEDAGRQNEVIGRIVGSRPWPIHSRWDVVRHIDNAGIPRRDCDFPLLRRHRLLRR